MNIFPHLVTTFKLCMIVILIELVNIFSHMVITFKLCMRVILIELDLLLPDFMPFTLF